MEEKIIEIDSYGYDGEGVGREEGKVTFVPLALRGEKVKVEIIDSRSSFQKARLVEVIEGSSLRITPPCKYFGRCGGCQYQHTTYKNELEIKKELLLSQLNKVSYEGEIEVKKSNSEYGYRNKIKLFVSEESLALKERGSNVLCDIDNCLLVSERMNNVIKVINRFLENQNLFDKFSEVIIREEGENLAVVFFCKERESKVNYQGLYLIIGTNCGIFESYNDILTHKIGKKTLNCEEFGLNCNFSPVSFHQVNSYVGEKLYNFVLSKIVGKSVINCYSGAGVLSGIIAKKEIKVRAIELGKSEHEDAEKLKEENNLFYLSNLQGDCGEVLGKVDYADTIIVDPPRKGIDEKVAIALNLKKCKRLIYISCNSATFVRDAQRLENYTLKKVTLFDMFARTGEYEVVGIFDLKK